MGFDSNWGLCTRRQGLGEKAKRDRPWVLGRTVWGRGAGSSAGRWVKKVLLTLNLEG